MDKITKEVLQVSKEITIKFIETQRISPANFAGVFSEVYRVVRETITGQREHE